jgi:hypothetical protein
MNFFRGPVDRLNLGCFPQRSTATFAAVIGHVAVPHRSTSSPPPQFVVSKNGVDFHDSILSGTSALREKMDT